MRVVVTDTRTKPAPGTTTPRAPLEEQGFRKGWSDCLDWVLTRWGAGDSPEEVWRAAKLIQEQRDKPSQRRGRPVR